MKFLTSDPKTALGLGMNVTSKQRNELLRDRFSQRWASNHEQSLRIINQDNTR